MAMLLKIPFSFQCRGEKRPARSLLAEWDFLPCVTVSVIAMSHFKDFMWVDGWSTTRERTVVKIPINEGQRNMTWSASGLYLPMTEAVDWNCIPSDLGCGSVLSVSAGRLHFPLLDPDSRPWAHIQQFIPYLFPDDECKTLEKKSTLALQKFFVILLYKLPSQAVPWHFFYWDKKQSSPAISNPVLCRGAITTYTELAEWACLWFLCLL